MLRTHSSTQGRLIQSALELFSSQGFTATTTRQIAELAEVNEVTLFRNFGSKLDLLLAVIQDADLFTPNGESLLESVNTITSLDQALEDYCRDRLQTLGQMPELLRSAVGESGQYTLENRQVLSQGINRRTQQLAEYLTTVMEREQVQPSFSVNKFASLLNGLLLGYQVMELLTEFHEPWADQADFLKTLTELCLAGAILSGSGSASPQQGTSSNSLPKVARSLNREALNREEQSSTVADLPAEVVHAILQQAKKQGSQNYAIAYVLFGAGLLPVELVALERSHHISNPRQHLLQIQTGKPRQVSVNQWIMGKRYGSYTSNPLSQWLKSRKDEQVALFINDSGQSLTEAELELIWQHLTPQSYPSGHQPPALGQARQTWCVEMLIKGIDLKDLSILSGWSIPQLQPYQRRAREKAALDRAIRLDQKA
ncbi:MAG: TetR family transcriptional regulator [Microcoleaceae cyanobacterium]